MGQKNRQPEHETAWSENLASPKSTDKEVVCPSVLKVKERLTRLNSILLNTGLPLLILIIVL